MILNNQRLFLATSSVNNRINETLWMKQLFIKIVTGAYDKQLSKRCELKLISKKNVKVHSYL